jgi:uncharacterized protein
MSGEPLSASLQSVRRLVVTKQHLAGDLPQRVTARTIVSLVRDLPYVQWDPVNIVAPSHLISLWSRLGDFRPAELDRLLWKERALFLHWIPVAAIVPFADYPLYRSLMTRYPDSLSKSWGRQKAEAKRFLARHSALRKSVLKALRNGPLLLGQFEEHARTTRSDGDWNPGSDLEHMLYHMLMSGDVRVVGHRGNQNLWGLSEQFLPNWVDRKELTEPDFEREAAQKAIRGLGTATAKEIHYYFPRGCYNHLETTLAQLEEEATIHRVTVEGLGSRDERYIHDQDVELLASMNTDAWKPRLSLLPPFDNMVNNQARLNTLFGFDYIREQFLPKEKRRYGTYVLPILWGDRFIGRIDPRLDKTSGKLVINAVFAEPDAPRDREIPGVIGDTIARFAAFLGASGVTYTSRVPAAWKGSLR